MVGETVTSPIDGKPVATVPSLHDVTPEQFHKEVRRAGRPVVLRGVAESWPSVAIGRSGDANALADYLLRYDSGAPLNTFVGDPRAGGRFIYNPEMTGYNFRREKVPAKTVIPAMLRFVAGERPYLYAGATSTNSVFPGFGDDNPMPLAPEGTQPLAWVGNPSRIAPHYDCSENIAVCVMGRRQFMLFPPEQVENLYIGPWENTPAGPECSVVDMREPDLETYPKYAKAREAALLADLQPGDAVYIPPLWWHTVEARGDFNLLVNYWWSAPGTNGMPMAAMAHALLTIRDLPATQRAAWKTMFDHYVFGEGAEGAGDHIPAHAVGVRGASSPERDQTIRAFIKFML